MARYKKYKTIKDVYILRDFNLDMFKEQYRKRLMSLLYKPFYSESEIIEAIEDKTDKTIVELIRDDIIDDSKGVLSWIPKVLFVRELRGERSIIEKLGNDQNVMIFVDNNGGHYAAKGQMHEEETTTDRLIRGIMSAETLKKVISKEYPKRHAYLEGMQKALDVIKAEINPTDFLDLVEQYKSKKQTMVGINTRVKTDYETLRDFFPKVTEFTNNGFSVREACREIANHFLTSNGYPVNPESLNAEYSNFLNTDCVDQVCQCLKNGKNVTDAINEVSQKTGVKQNILQEKFDNLSR